MIKIIDLEKILGTPDLNLGVPHFSREISETGFVSDVSVRTELDMKGMYVWRSVLCDFTLLENNDDSYMVVVSNKKQDEKSITEIYTDWEQVCKRALDFRWCFEIEYNEHPADFHARRISGATLYQGVMFPDGKAWVVDEQDEDYNPISMKKTNIFAIMLDSNLGSIEFYTQNVQEFLDLIPD